MPPSANSRRRDCAPPNCRPRTKTCSERMTNCSAFMPPLQADLDAQRAAAAELRGAATGSTAEREALLRELERVTNARTSLEASLTELREQSGKAVASADRLQRELEQARAEETSSTLNWSGRARRRPPADRPRSNRPLPPQDDMPAGSFDQVATIERERNALSLALDTERMMSADLRAALTSTERRLAETTSEIDALRAEISRVGVEGTGLPADTLENLTELTFDEDNSGATHEDGAITIEEEGWESVRLSTRYSFTSRIDVKVNGTPAVLTDLSITGCGVHTMMPLQTGQSVRLQLPGDPHPLLCPGEVVWVRKDSSTGKGSGGVRVRNPVHTVRRSGDRSLHHHARRRLELDVAGSPARYPVRYVTRRRRPKTPGARTGRLPARNRAVCRRCRALARRPGSHQFRRQPCAPRRRQPSVLRGNVRRSRQLRPRSPGRILDPRRHARGGRLGPPGSHRRRERDAHDVQRGDAERDDARRTKRNADAHRDVAPAPGRPHGLSPGTGRLPSADADRRTRGERRSPAARCADCVTSECRLPQTRAVGHMAPTM